MHVNLRNCGEGHTTRPGLRVGADVVDVQAIEMSLQTFGARFERRIFTPHEVDVARGSAQRLAARLAAKEAVIKALDLAEVGVDWRHIEVSSDSAGRPSLRLHGRAAQRAHELGVQALALSLSHEGRVALAAVVAQLAPPEAPDSG